MTCLGFSVWWRYRAQWGPLRQFEGTVHGAHGKPLQIAGKTQHLGLQWGEACGRACFIVIVGLESPPCLIGMDIMRPLRVHIHVTNGTATPAQPDPQTVQLNAAQSQQRRRKIPSPEIGLPAVGAACPPQSQQQRKEMPLPKVDLPAVGTACPASNPAAANENTVARSWLDSRGSRLSVPISAATKGNAAARNLPTDYGSRLFVSPSAATKGNAVA